MLKKLCPQEDYCYKLFKSDALSKFVPDYQGNLMNDDESKAGCLVNTECVLTPNHVLEFIQLQDCLSSFNMPSIMDCKIGVR